MTGEPADSVNEEQFVGAAESRIRRFFWIAAALGLTGCVAAATWALAVGFALGALASFASMAHLQRAVRAFTTNRESAGAIVMRFLMRFAVITLIAYAIFRVSRPALYGYVAALFLPVTAMTCEAALEAWFALRGRRG
ncbi:MAG: hypothetical protein JO041_03375 [Acidobacteria bacterium]|nr:hypothetical protein [Acidobacteriota bacterium]